MHLRQKYCNFIWFYPNYFLNFALWKDGSALCTAISPEPIRNHNLKPTPIMMTYEYTLYESHRNAYLGRMLREACFVWNHALALQRRYYALFKGYIDVYRMQRHFRKCIKRFLLHSQTVQEILQRLNQAYQRFFKKLAKRPPKFKKAEQFSSFVFKGSGGYKLDKNKIKIKKISKCFGFFLSRPYSGKVKNVRIKRRPTGQYSLYIVTDVAPRAYVKIPKQAAAKGKEDGKTHNGAAPNNAVGMDFGIKTFLTLSDGTTRTCPEYLRKSLSKISTLNRNLSKCKKGSSNYKAIKAKLARLHEYIADCRRDWHWKLAHELCRQFDIICIEDLNISGMKKLWGRKVSDMAFTSFVEILNHVASKYGVRIKKVGRYYASSKTCSACGNVNHSLTLKERTWVCPKCGAVHDRDLNAAINILNTGLTL